MHGARCELVRWVSDDPRPGMVEALLVDANGVRWSFLDKPVIFTPDPVSSATPFPIPAVIRCEVRGITHDGQGREVVDVALLDGVESVDGTSQFGALPDQLVELD